jgi:hypothetical protein
MLGLPKRSFQSPKMSVSLSIGSGSLLRGLLALPELIIGQTSRPSTGGSPDSIAQVSVAVVFAREQKVEYLQMQGGGEGMGEERVEVSRRLFVPITTVNDAMLLSTADMSW